MAGAVRCVAAWAVKTCPVVQCLWREERQSGTQVTQTHAVLVDHTTCGRSTTARVRYCTVNSHKGLRGRKEFHIFGKILSLLNCVSVSAAVIAISDCLSAWLLFSDTFQWSTYMLHRYSYDVFNPYEPYILKHTIPPGKLEHIIHPPYRTITPYDQQTIPHTVRGGNGFVLVRKKNKGCRMVVIRGDNLGK